jgi:hypothetical protein
MDLFDTLTWAEILEKTTFLDTPTLTVLEDEQFQTCLANFPADSMVSVIDFVENYSFEIQNEV